MEYAMLSSPAAQHFDTPPDDQRWNNRPMMPGQVPPPGLPSTGRADATRVAMTQRSGLGTVSVGNGLFGR